ncbi:MAG: tRNA pseudouridine(55) synthase TruB [Acidimicrobiaceae bacterium]|nr:tRNA pseudouridine(55) synthase TruB [Acidimicrobiaceae bacterium]
MATSAGPRRDDGPHGVLVVDKQAGWTSHDVVAKCRGIFGTRKIGHAGTLDPSATGVLVLGVGRATRLLRFVTELPKSYLGEIVFGAETSTLDADGEICARHDMSGLQASAVLAAARQFVGSIKQVPPMVSAVKVDGKRLYALAREGKVVERRARAVFVYRFALEPLAAESGVWRCEVDCSSGTYIRSLAADLGAALGGGAYLRALRRVAVGDFTVEQAQSVENALLLPVSAAVAHLDYRIVSDEVAVRVGHGQVFDDDVFGDPVAGLCAVKRTDGSLLAVYAPNRNQLKPLVVL